jgi:hypothetical protein
LFQNLTLKGIEPIGGLKGLPAMGKAPGFIDEKDDED